MKKSIITFALMLIVAASQALAFDEEKGIHNANTGQPVYINQLAAYYHSQGRYEEALEWYRKGAEKDFAPCMNAIGFCYEHGQGVDVDYDQAFYWYSRGAALDHDVSINSLGNCYMYGYGCKKDPDKAFQLFQRAVDMGNSPAMVNLGVMYDEGLGCVQDRDRALQLYEQALKVNPRNHLAKSSIAFHHFYTLLDLEGDHKDAATEVLEFFNNTDVDPQDRPELPFVFGVSYYYVDDPQSVELLQEAYNNREGSYSRGVAARLLGFIYNNGYCGVAQDQQEGSRWFERAAALGDEDSVEVLNILHEIFNDTY